MLTLVWDVCVIEEDIIRIGPLLSDLQDDYYAPGVLAHRTVEDALSLSRQLVVSFSLENWLLREMKRLSGTEVALQ